jgi:hypothetical protein
MHALETQQPGRLAGIGTAWMSRRRGMTERGRLERHVISLAQVERTATEYHCGP